MDDRITKIKTESRRSRFKDWLVAGSIVCAGGSFFLTSIISPLAEEISDYIMELQTVARNVYVAVVVLFIAVFVLRIMRRLNAGSKG